MRQWAGAAHRDAYHSRKAAGVRLDLTEVGSWAERVCYCVLLSAVVAVGAVYLLGLQFSGLRKSDSWWGRHWGGRWRVGAQDMPVR